MPTFVPTAAGSYTFQLVVNDGPAFSSPATVTIMVPDLGRRKGRRPKRENARGIFAFSSSGK